MNKFVNPFSDYGWKKIFGSEVSKDLIISFLNEVIQQEVIVDITFRNVMSTITSCWITSLRKLMIRSLLTSLPKIFFQP